MAGWFIPYYNEVMVIVETNEQLKESATGIIKQTGWTAGGTVVGGVLGGPPGALLGAVTGAVIGYWRSDEYSSMIKVLKNLTERDKEKLVIAIQGLVKSRSIDALKGFILTKAQRGIFLELLRDQLGSMGKKT